MTTVPRLRMIAGPNGAGKSTIEKVLPPGLLGVYINPDEIEKDIRASGCLDVGAYGLRAESEEIISFFRRSRLLQNHGLSDAADRLRFKGGKLTVTGGDVNAYFASATADFLRQKLLSLMASFTFETVMSSSDKIDLLKKARGLGYRTYLYYIATDDPAINVSRVRNRVKLGGHALGASGITQLHQGYLQNEKDTDRFRARVLAGEFPFASGYRMTPEDIAVRAIVNGLLCNGSADVDAALDSVKLDPDWKARYRVESVGKLQSFLADGFVAWENGKVAIAEEGLPLARMIAAAFDPRHKANAGKLEYSRAL